MKIKELKLGKKLLLIIAIIILICVIALIFYKLSIYVDMERRFKEFESKNAVETTGTLSYKKEDDIAIVDNMDFINQDNLGVKVDSISVNDHTLTANLSFKTDKEFDYKTFSYSFAIYDESNNIYEISSRMHLGENEKYDYNSIFMQRELGINNKKDIYSIYLADRSGIEGTSKNDDVITTTIKIEAKEKFPQSKKLYIKVFDIGYYEFNNENNEPKVKNFNLSDMKWLFELDIPEEMNNRNTIELKLEEEISGLKITNATLTNTNLVINFESEDYMNLVAEGKDMPNGEFTKKSVEMLNITDEEGNVYQELGGGTTENNGFKMTYDVTLKDLSKKLFINYKIDNKQYKSELIKK